MSPLKLLPPILKIVFPLPNVSSRDIYCSFLAVVSSSMTTSFLMYRALLLWQGCGVTGDNIPSSYVYFPFSGTPSGYSIDLLNPLFPRLSAWRLLSTHQGSSLINPFPSILPPFQRRSSSCPFSSDIIVSPSPLATPIFPESLLTYGAPLGMKLLLQASPTYLFYVVQRFRNIQRLFKRLAPPLWCYPGPLL